MMELTEAHMNQGPKQMPAGQGVGPKEQESEAVKTRKLFNVTLQPLKLPAVSSLLPYSLFFFKILPQFF